MRHVIGKLLLILALVAAGIVWNGDIRPNSQGGFVTTAEAIIGRPLTPVSYAGVARRTTVRVATTPMNRGGPVNRVGRF